LLPDPSFLLNAIRRAELRARSWSGGAVFQLQSMPRWVL
jgi:hypothetical protein